MFTSFEAAYEYAKTRHYTDGIIMEKDGRFNVAKDWEEAEYAQSCGWKIAE